MTEHKKNTRGLVRAQSSQMHCGLECRNVKIITSEGRCLVRDLNMKLGAEDKVAIVGRNGVGKSTLLNVLSGQQEPHRGSVRIATSLHLVRQTLISDQEKVGQHAWNSTACRKDMALLGIASELLYGEAPKSFGEARKVALLRAKYSNADLLLLDEPSQDLDALGIAWLIQCLRSWRGALLIVSHEPRILAEFRHFFYMAESGARLLSGDASDVVRIVAEEQKAAEKKYQRMMRSLSSDEFHSALVARRRLRKDRGGRMREIDRAPSRGLLNSKRSYAQESQGRRRKVQELRIGVARSEVKSFRESLVVKMPLSQLAPDPIDDLGTYSVQLVGVGASVRGRSLFTGLDVSIARDRVALTGPNGSGKTTLLDIVRGHRSPDAGVAIADKKRIAIIAQGASNWLVDDSLLERLERLSDAKDWQARLREHQFPLALAMRGMSGLSPGERTRAALVALMEAPGVDLLILDEPCSGLDTSARFELASLLRTWQSGLLVASHDRQFLRGVRIEKEIGLSFFHAGKFSDFSA